MRYGLAFGYFINKPGGTSNLLLCTLCQMIPFVGPIVTAGYQAEVCDELHQDPDQRDHPDFRFEYFTEYLKRGVYPFVMNLLLSIPIMGIFVLAWFGMFFAGLLLQGGGQALVLILVLFAFGMIVGISTAALSLPMTLHAKLAGRLDIPGAFRFGIDFWRTLGFHAIGAYLLTFLISIPVGILGELCCLIGIFPASTIIQMAYLHITMQLYEDYLDRGGEPVVIFEVVEEWDDDWEEDDRPRHQRNRRPQRARERYEDEEHDYTG